MPSSSMIFLSLPTYSALASLEPLLPRAPVNLLKVMPWEMKAAFFERFQLTQSEIIDRVYRRPMANRFLASLVPFLVENRSETCIHELIVDSFSSFFNRNVRNYSREDLPVNFVGGIAAQFESELREAAENEGFVVGEIERSPIAKMVSFHCP